MMDQQQMYTFVEIRYLMSMMDQWKSDILAKQGNKFYVNDGSTQIIYTSFFAGLRPAQKLVSYFRGGITNVTTRTHAQPPGTS